MLARAQTGARPYKVWVGPGKEYLIQLHEKMVAIAYFHFHRYYTIFLKESFSNGKIANLNTLPQFGIMQNKEPLVNF